MYVKISKSDEIFERLKLEGRVKTLDSLEDIKVIEEMNEAMRNVRRDYLYKSAMSEISASECYVNGQ